jgi:hypothetical protein
MDVERRESRLERERERERERVEEEEGKIFHFCLNLKKMVIDLRNI